MSSINFSWSKVAFIISFLIIVYANFFYYPKWDKPGTNAVISWDVSGYYMYLPALFIYKDIKKCDFKDDVIKKYWPTPNFQQAFKHSSGNYVMKYSCGQAIQYLPFFFIGHLWATVSDDYPPDGFSLPYQFMINIGSLVFAFLGLFFLRKILLLYFRDSVVASVLLTTVIGTNYLSYTAFSGAMSHNYLFTIYAILIYTTIQFYKVPTLKKSLLIGFLIGLAALTRPTEILAAIIPVAWGLNFLSLESVLNRIKFFRENFRFLLLSVLACLLVGSLQLIYWKYAANEWIVYSYEEQGFSWLNPHVWDCLFSYRSGWLVYSPVMVFALIGFLPLAKSKKNLWFTFTIFSLLFMYIAFAWDIWWYGGSLGQRTMVQIYPILAFPLAAFYAWLFSTNKLKQSLLFLVICSFLYINLWYTHQAHKGGLLHVGSMTKAYFWKVLGTYEKNENDLKLLDTEEEFIGDRKNIKELYFNDFENDSLICNSSKSPIQGKNSICLNKKKQFSSEYFVTINSTDADWIRLSADFRCSSKEWEPWRMAQFAIKFYGTDGTVIKKNSIRVFRLLNKNDTRNIFFDTSIPNGKLTKIGVFVWNAGSSKEILIDNLKIESFTD